MHFTGLSKDSHSGLQLSIPNMSLFSKPGPIKKPVKKPVPDSSSSPQTLTEPTPSSQPSPPQSSESLSTIPTSNSIESSEEIDL